MAGGNGLVEMERLSIEVSLATGVDVQPIGFDLGSGMPAPQDYRDLPYIWQKGFFSMDEKLLRNRLTSARLIVGDVAETLTEFLDAANAPIGFISFDVDYYTSTSAALSALGSSDVKMFAPRVFCYFDDTVGPHEELHSRFAGELLAIDEFNEQNMTRKIAPVNGLAYKLWPHVEPWIMGFHVLHLFAHPEYDSYVFHERNRQFPLEPRPASGPPSTEKDL